ncbi:MAG: hypothetical protein H5T63_10400, partial [Chloroflexi bacterium]|nr:hypothetical protein [Chloroflexota bacterium]
MESLPSVALIVLLLATVACRPPTPQGNTPSPSPTAPLIPSATPTVTKAPLLPTPTATLVVQEATSTATARPPTATPQPATATPMPPPSPTPVPWPELTVPYVKSLVVTPDEPPVYYLVVGNALYRSPDRGATWSIEALPGIPADATVTCVAIDYRHPQTMYIATSKGLYRRERAGEPWELVNTLYVTALAVDFLNPDVLWAGTGWNTALQAVIVKSTDRGRTWGKADYGVGIGDGGAWVGAILIHPNNPNILWAHVRPGTRHDWPRGYVYRGGRDGTWERLPLGEFDFISSPDPFGGENEDVCFVSGLAYDPNLNALYAGCDISYYNGTDWTYRLLRSRNADAPNSADVRWEVIAE